MCKFNDTFDERLHNVSLLLTYGQNFFMRNNFGFLLLYGSSGKL